MAYCVHCGVKLGQGEKRCPLCRTVSVDPHEADTPAAAKAYPIQTPDQLLKRNKTFFLMLFGLLLLVPALMCLLIDLLIGGTVTWSIYAFTALILLYISIAVPIWVDQHRIYFAMITCYACLMLYLKMVETVSQSGRWFFPIVLPVATLCLLVTLFLAFLYRRKKLGHFTLFGAAAAATAIICVMVDLSISYYTAGPALLWSPYVSAPCLFIALLVFFINGNKTIREELRRRVHF